MVHPIATCGRSSADRSFAIPIEDQESFAPRRASLACSRTAQASRPQCARVHRCRMQVYVWQSEYYLPCRCAQHQPPVPAPIALPSIGCAQYRLLSMLRRELCVWFPLAVYRANVHPPAARSGLPLRIARAVSVKSGRHRSIALRRRHATDRRSRSPVQSRTVSFALQDQAPTLPGSRTRSWENWWNRSRAKPCPADERATARAQPGHARGLPSRIARSSQDSACVRRPAPRQTDRGPRKKTSSSLRTWMCTRVAPAS